MPWRRRHHYATRDEVQAVAKRVTSLAKVVSVDESDDRGVRDRIASLETRMDKLVGQEHKLNEREDGAGRADGWARRTAQGPG